MQQYASFVVGRWSTSVNIMMQMVRLNQEGKVNMMSCMSLI